VAALELSAKSRFPKPIFQRIGRHSRLTTVRFSVNLDDRPSLLSPKAVHIPAFFFKAFYPAISG
jgi:hypothetical protein